MWDVSPHSLSVSREADQRGLREVFMDESVEVPDRGLRRNAVGLPALVAQSLGVTAPEISAVVIAAVVASKVAGATPFAFIVAGIGALGLALIYGRFARYVPHAGGTY